MGHPAVQEGSASLGANEIAKDSSRTEPTVVTRAYHGASLGSCRDMAISKTSGGTGKKEDSAKANKNNPKGP
ncbi:hypothetical protein P378_09505 [Desulforamulus profundi]|uniref:Uncharacterized protein n=1 Tax=Desulforamulus profundi TaxID=1383067 RepID=A0A2C6MED7_9FIRM|nr:hypothetical protein P378_09505 [Desulforamulus profundi]